MSFLCDSSCVPLCHIPVPPSEDHHPGGGGRPRAGGRRSLDPAARHRQDRPQEPSADAHQRQSEATRTLKSPPTHSTSSQLSLLLQCWEQSQIKFIF